MAASEKTKKYLQSQIAEGHERLIELMDKRLADHGAEELEKYFAVLSKLVAKLEDDQKPLRQAAKEMVAETAAMVMSELAE